MINPVRGHACGSRPTFTTPCAERPAANTAVKRMRYTKTAKPDTVATRMKMPEYLVQKDGDNGQAAQVPSPAK